MAAFLFVPAKGRADLMLALVAVLPISQVSSVASCIYHIACALPLEKALNVAAPARWAEERERRMRIQSRITTRRRDDEEEREDGRRAEPVICERPVGEREEGVGEERWTAGDILQGWAEYRGYGKHIWNESLKVQGTSTDYFCSNSYCESRTTGHEQGRKRE